MGSRFYWILTWIQSTEFQNPNLGIKKHQLVLWFLAVT